jgi:colanic acid biosynthesis glycosyl transferase WcaI
LKVLLLNQTFHPDVASSGQHLADLASALADSGHEVTVITGRRAYNDPKTLFAKHETWHGVNIRRIKSTGLGKSAKWRRCLDSASFMALCTLRMPWLMRHDVVIALTSPPLISVIGLTLARLHKSRFLYWVMDLNPDEAIAAGWIASKSWISRILNWLSQVSLRGADRVIALDQAMYQRIAAKGVPPEKIVVLPPWSHDSQVRFSPEGRKRFREQHGLSHRFVVMYSGNHSACHSLETLVSAAQRLAQDSSIAFCFVGGGTEFRKIQTRLAESPNILCLSYQPLNRLSASLSAADAHVVVMGNAMIGLVHPCKTYNLLRVGRPIIYIGPWPSPIAQVVVQTPNSACLSHGDVDGLVRHIVKLRNGWGSSPSFGSFSSASQFSKETILPRLVELMGNRPQNRPK